MLKNGLLFNGFINLNFTRGQPTPGLAYDSNITVQDLVNKSTTGDGIPDWEKILYGLDPTKRENVPGVPDSVTIQKIQASQAVNVGITNENNQGTENLTKTDEFSRELFSTLASLSENGSMDQATVDQISSSLADKIQNSTPRKIYTLADIKIINNDTAMAVQKYNNTLVDIYKKYPTPILVGDVLVGFMGDGTTIDPNASAKLSLIIEQMRGVISGWVKTAVPDQLAQTHLDTVNGMERILENVSDIQLYNDDPIIAIGAIENYQKNLLSLQSALETSTNAINQKLKS